ncbi:MAG: hypothetical protein IJ057_12145 [Bacteroidales bacterium]|nr:hypothetical protein [Bacteroidales bacterium]
MIDQQRERYINPYTDLEYERLLNSVEITQLSPMERFQHEERLKIYRDLKNSMDTSFNKGRLEGKEEGRAEGKAEGKAEANIENARKMKALGISPDIIAQVTGLSEEEIERL